MASRIQGHDESKGLSWREAVNSFKPPNGVWEGDADAPPGSVGSEVGAGSQWPLGEGWGPHAAHHPPPLAFLGAEPLHALCRGPLLTLPRALILLMPYCRVMLAIRWTSSALQLPAGHLHSC